MSKFFSYDSDCGIQFHATAEEAKAEAVHCLNIERDAATLDGEWDDAVDEIFWGEIREFVVASYDGEHQDYVLKEPA